MSKPTAVTPTNTATGYPRATVNPNNPLGCLIVVDRRADGRLVLLAEMPGTESTLSLTRRSYAA